MTAFYSPKNRFFNLMRYTWALLGVWTFILVGLMAKEFFDIKQYTKEIALNTARAHLNKDTSFRLWGSLHGGVLCEVTSVGVDYGAAPVQTDFDSDSWLGQAVALVTTARTPIMAPLHEARPRLRVGERDKVPGLFLRRDDRGEVEQPPKQPRRPRTGCDDDLSCP